MANSTFTFVRKDDHIAIQRGSYTVGSLICMDESVADFIDQACRSHTALLAAAKRAQPLMEDHGSFSDNEAELRASGELTRAIALAQGEEPPADTLNPRFLVKVPGNDGLVLVWAENEVDAAQQVANELPSPEGTYTVYPVRKLEYDESLGLELDADESGAVDDTPLRERERGMASRG